MGLLGEKDWEGKWINDGKEVAKEERDFYEDDPSPLFRKVFDRDKAIKMQDYILAVLAIMRLI